MELPPEILGSILGVLRKRDLKQARLVSKKFERAAVSYLFNEIFISTNHTDFPVASLTIEHFSIYTKNLIFSSVHYEYLIWNDYKEISIREGSRARRLGGSIPPRLDDHIKMRYNEHYKVLEYEQQMFGKAHCVTQLSFALQKLPNLRKIVLTDEGSVANRRTRGRGSWTIDQDCSVPGCNLSTTEHGNCQAYQVRPKSGLATALSNPLDLVSLAMWSANKGVKEIVMRPHDESSSYPMRCFSELVYQCTHDIRHIFQSLTRLDLNLQINGSQFQTPYYINRGVAKVLSVAKNLEDLCLRLSYPFMQPSFSGTTPFQFCLGGCRFPKLKTIIFLTCHSSSDEKLAFLRGCPKMERLSLVGHALISGRWEETSEQIRACASLKNVVLDGLQDGGIGWKGSWPAGHAKRYRDCYGRVRKFFSCNGANPFSQIALDQYDKDRAADKDCPAGKEGPWDPGWFEQTTELLRELND